MYNFLYIKKKKNGTLNEGFQKRQEKPRGLNNDSHKYFL